MALALTSVDTTSDPEARRVAARRDRYAALAVIRRETRLKSRRPYFDPKTGEQKYGSRLANCRKAVNDTAGGVELRLTSTPDGPRAGLAGLQTCGSVWACTVCSEKINAARQAELEAGINSWIGRGHAVLFLTLTMRHNKGDRLADPWDAISPAWNKTTSGAGVAWNGSRRANGDIGDKARFGIKGYTRLVETKHGEHGWHPHVHALLFVDEALSPAQLFDLRSRLFGRWERQLAKHGYSVLESVGVDLRAVEDGSGVADYFAKNTYGIAPSGAAYEVTGSQSKRLGKGGETPFQLLARLVETGDADALDLWHEWEKASQGRRQLTWSRGMRDLLDLEPEATDQELAEAELEADTSVAITVEEWTGGRLWERVPDLLDAVEDGTLTAAFPWLARPDRWAKIPPKRASRRLDNRPRVKDD